MEILKFHVVGPEGFTEITDQIKDYIARNRVKDGLIMLQVPDKSTFVTFADPKDPNIEREFINKMGKVLPRYDGMRFTGWSTMNIKATFIGQTMQIMVQQGSLVLGLHQGIFAGDFGGPKDERMLFISHLGTTLAESEEAQEPEILVEMNRQLIEEEARKKAEEEQAVREMREEYNAKLKYMQEHPEDTSVRSDRELF